MICFNYPCLALSTLLLHMDLELTAYKPFRDQWDIYAPLKKNLFKSTGVMVSHFFSMLPSTLKYLYSLVCYTIQLMHYSHFKTLSLQHSQADHQQTRTLNMHRWHIHAATYCLIIQTQWTQISGRNSNSTKHSGGPPEDGREKRPKHVGVLYLQTRF